MNARQCLDIVYGHCITTIAVKCHAILSLDMYELLESRMELKTIDPDEKVLLCWDFQVDLRFFKTRCKSFWQKVLMFCNNHAANVMTRKKNDDWKHADIRTRCLCLSNIYSKVRFSVKKMRYLFVNGFICLNIT